jgi:hypothetical protein
VADYRSARQFQLVLWFYCIISQQRTAKPFTAISYCIAQTTQFIAKPNRAAQIKYYILPLFDISLLLTFSNITDSKEENSYNFCQNSASVLELLKVSKCEIFIS